jgi:hypothetical protein
MIIEKYIIASIRSTQLLSNVNIKCYTNSYQNYNNNGVTAQTEYFLEPNYSYSDTFHVLTDIDFGGTNQIYKIFDTKQEAIIQLENYIKRYNYYNSNFTILPYLYNTEEITEIRKYKIDDFDKQS